MKELNQQPLQDCVIRNLVTYAHRISRGCNLVLSIEQVASATTARLRNAALFEDAAQKLSMLIEAPE